jgi:hypothetical protein
MIASSCSSVIMVFFFWVWMGPRRSGNGAMFLFFEEFFVEPF